MPQGESARRGNTQAIDLGHRGIEVHTARIGRWIRGERSRPQVDRIPAVVLR
ncbi:hypothetical protein [Umezawaea sp. Da 62-37]|uniref:hypothetical protein n=1 Tax=Umezawaea sp. Da 62-37 TaxID=3075927 RepID=UPI0028F6DEB7|nr:hypothetical protein [Umezawaea sp. Da 62-37]WNV84742.1 hypothetical protein RM788_42360 [Umezawaea sp. Da 62-37]